VLQQHIEGKHFVFTVKPRHGFGIVLALVAATGLAGCVGTPATTTSAPPSNDATTLPSDPPIANPSQTPVPSDTPTPTPTPTPTLAPTVLFTITATVLGKRGAKVDVTQTVYKPVTATPDQAADSALLDDQCGGWKTMFPDAKFITTTVTAKLEAGSPAWSKNDPLGVSMDGYPAWSGSYHGFQAECASVILLMKGNIHGVAPVPATNSADGKYGWARIGFGFGLANESSSTAAPKAGATQFTACSVALSDDAKTSVIARKWATQTQKYPGLGCSFGVGY
jgi:hypothetical protein